AGGGLGGWVGRGRRSGRAAASESAETRRLAKYHARSIMTAKLSTLRPTRSHRTQVAPSRVKARKRAVMSMDLRLLSTLDRSLDDERPVEEIGAAALVATDDPEVHRRARRRDALVETELGVGLAGRGDVLGEAAAGGEPGNRQGLGDGPRRRAGDDHVVGLGAAGRESGAQRDLLA